MTDSSVAPATKIWKVKVTIVRLSNCEYSTDLESSLYSEHDAKLIAEKNIILRNDHLNDVGNSPTFTSLIDGKEVTEFIYCPSLQLETTYTTWVEAENIDQATTIGLQRIENYHTANPPQ